MTHPAGARRLARQTTLSAALSAALSALFMLGTPPAHAGATAPALTLTAPGTVFDGTPYSLGFAFSVQTDVSLQALGVWDAGGDGLASTATVGLWRDGQTDPLAQATVAAGTAAALDGGFRWSSVAPLRLSAGQRYVVAAYLDGGSATSLGFADAATGAAGQGQVDARVTLIEDRFADGFFALAYPGQSDGHAGGAWLGANLQIGAVPESAPAAMLAAGLATLALLTRRRRH